MVCRQCSRQLWMPIWWWHITKLTSTRSRPATLMLDTSGSPSCCHFPQLLELITVNLSARDAISLSISCRSLFHGVLNASNYTLWFRVGGFRRIVTTYNVPLMPEDQVEKRSDLRNASDNADTLPVIYRRLHKCQMSGCFTEEYLMPADHDFRIAYSCTACGNARLVL